MNGCLLPPAVPASLFVAVVALFVGVVALFDAVASLFVAVAFATHSLSLASQNELVLTEPPVSLMSVEKLSLEEFVDVV